MYFSLGCALPYLVVRISYRTCTKLLLTNPVPHHWQRLPSVSSEVVGSPGLPVSPPPLPLPEEPAQANSEVIGLIDADQPLELQMSDEAVFDTDSRRFEDALVPDSIEEDMYSLEVS